MKKILSVIIILLGIFTINSTPTLAAKRAIFPDSKSLQPIPQNAYPNVSGNVNSTVDPSAPTSIEEPIDQIMPIQESSTDDQPERGSSSFLWWIIIPLTIIIFIFAYIKLKKKQ